MRPLNLRMKGFGAFREDTEVDFTDVELAALVGPTGSGKSTIIDGLTFALFGSVARYDDSRVVAPVINQLDTEARVALDFEVGGELYTAVRVVRRTTDGATTKEARLEKGETILAGRASEMAPAVERLLGLDFDRFTKTVVLPQGRFAQFFTTRLETAKNCCVTCSTLAYTRAWATRPAARQVWPEPGSKSWKVGRRRVSPVRQTSQD